MAVLQIIRTCFNLVFDSKKENNKIPRTGFRDLIAVSMESEKAIFGFLSRSFAVRGTNFKYAFSTLFSILFISTSLLAQNSDHLKYIDKYKKIAISEMERAGIPASIKLAQGILESNAGKSYLARKANNHFGIKCHSNWKGKKVYREDDDYDENGKLQKSCFRAYKNAEASYIAHSEFLRDSKKTGRYGFLFRLKPTDYKRWARGLKRAGYATSATYAEKLISIIERYELHQYDRMTPGEVVAPEPPPIVEKTLRINDAKVVYAKEGDTPNSIASANDMSVKSILKYNEKIGHSNTRLKEGTRVFIQPKRGSFRGRQEWHTVVHGENMYSISQLYGMKLSKLYKRNRMKAGQEPALGERLRLRWKAKKRPKLRSEVRDNPNKVPELIIDEKSEEVEIDGTDLPVIEPEIIPEPTPPPTNKPNSEPQEETVPHTPPVVEDKPPTSTTPTETPIYHTVVSGETLYRISKKYNITVDEILKLNNMTSTIIRKGQKIRVR